MARDFQISQVQAIRNNMNQPSGNQLNQQQAQLQNQQQNRALT